MSLYIPPKDQLNKVMQHLTIELAQAENIKSRQTRQSVCQAITSTRESKWRTLKSLINHISI